MSEREILCRILALNELLNIYHCPEDADFRLRVKLRIEVLEAVLGAESEE